MRTSIHVSLLAASALLLGSFIAAPAFADSAAANSPPWQAASSATMPGAHAQRAQRALRIAGDPALAAIQQMRILERIYLRQNQPKLADRMYREVLDRTQNTMVRNFVNFRLAKLAAWQPRNLDGVLVELRRGLDENLSKVQ